MQEMFGRLSEKDKRLYATKDEKAHEELGIDIRVPHYPPYTSKWNPIEHRVFPHITRTLQGMVLASHQITMDLIERATTKTGLSVVACILNKVYETKRKVVAVFKESMRIFVR